MGRGTTVAIGTGALLAAGLAGAVAFALHDRAWRHLEQRLDLELAQERARMPLRRPALRDARAGGELYAAIDAALAELAAPPPASASSPPRPRPRAGSFVFDDDDDGPTEPAGVPESRRPQLARLRDALRCEEVDVLGAILAAPASDAARRRKLRGVEEARALLRFACEEATKAGKNLEASQIALDAWQLEHDLLRREPAWNAREEGMGDLVRAASLLHETLPLLASRELETVARELERLEAGAPCSKDAFRWRRLAAGVALRSLHAKACAASVGPEEGDKTTDLARIDALLGEGKSKGRPEVLWPMLNAALDIGEEAASEPTHRAALERGLNGPDVVGPVGDMVSPLVLSELALEAEDVARMRAQRLVALVRRWRLENGHFPGSLAEATGGKSRGRDEDPADGDPFDLEITGDDVHVKSRRFETGF